MIDRDGRNAAVARIDDLDRLIRQAELFADLDGLAALESEKKAYVRRLAAAQGFRGRPRRLGSDHDKTVTTVHSTGTIIERYGPFKKNEFGETVHFSCGGTGGVSDVTIVVVEDPPSDRRDGVRHLLRAHDLVHAVDSVIAEVGDRAARAVAEVTPVHQEPPRIERHLRRRPKEHVPIQARRRI